MVDAAVAVDENQAVAAVADIVVVAAVVVGVVENHAVLAAEFEFDFEHFVAEFFAADTVAGGAVQVLVSGAGVVDPVAAALAVVAATVDIAELADAVLPGAAARMIAYAHV